MESLEDLFAIFGERHRGLPFWVRDMAVNDKADPTPAATRKIPGGSRVDPPHFVGFRRPDRPRGSNDPTDPITR
jgi:hypothetical protein